MIRPRDMWPVRLNARQWPRVQHPIWWRPTCMFWDLGAPCHRRAEETILMFDRCAAVCTYHARLMCEMYGALANPRKHVNGQIQPYWPSGNRKMATDHLKWLRRSGRPIQ